MMKFIELLFEKLNGWMEPFPSDKKAKMRKRMFLVALVYLMFIVFMVCLMLIVNSGKK